MPEIPDAVANCLVRHSFRQFHITNRYTALAGFTFQFSLFIRRIDLRHQFFRTTVLTVFLIVFASIAAATPDKVQNNEPAHEPVVVELAEQWRVGGEADEHIFGLMIDARCDDAGNVYLLDHQLSRVTMVSPTGEYVRELGGEGDGPGECRTPQTITMMPDGSVGLGQRFPGKFIKVDKDGLPAGNLIINSAESDGSGFTMLLSGRNRGGTLLACTLVQLPGENGQSRNSYLLRLSDEGEIVTSYQKHETTLDFGKPHFLEREMVAPFVAAHTVGPAGKVYFTPARNEYRIDVHHADGSPDKIITRKFDNPPRDSKTMDRMNALFEEQDRALPFKITWEVEKVDQTIGELIALPDGRLQVAHSRSGIDLPDGVFTSYDIFDTDGTWSHELHVRCDADPNQDGLIFLDDGRVLLVKGLQMARLTASGNGGAVGEEEDGQMTIEIICCQPVIQ